LEIVDEFIEGASSINYNSTGWIAISIGTGAQSGVAGSSNPKVFGLRNIQTGTDINGYSILHLNRNNYRLGVGNIAHSLWFGNFEIQGLSDGTNTYQLDVGSGDASTAAEHTDGFFFRYDSTVSPNWRYAVAAGGVVTIATGSVAATVAAQTLLVEVSSDGSRADFWVGNVHIGTHNTGIPSGAQVSGPVIRISKSVGTSSRVATFDACNLTSVSNEGRF
jgi:hypothetical protein